MSDLEFRAVLDWWMCSDPFPCPPTHKAIVDEWLNREAKQRGYKNLVTAFHNHKGDEK